MSIPVTGNANSATPAEVEANTNALRSTLRPDAYGVNGHYLAGEQRGNMSAGLAAASPIVSFRYGGNGVCLIRRVTFSFFGAQTAFTAGSAQFNLFVARSFTVSDTGGVSMFAGGDQMKLRSSMGTSQVIDYRSSNTATLTAGTRTLDAQPLASISVPVVATANTMFIPDNTFLIDQGLGAHPLALVNNEGYVIQATVPATGTWGFDIHTYWEELASY